MAETAKQGALVAIEPDALLAKAVEHGANIDALERLIALRERVKAEQAREMFFEDLARLQARLPTIEKRKKADRYFYAPIEDIIAQTRDLIAEHGFSYRWEYQPQDRGLLVACIVNHRAGHSERTEMVMPFDVNARINETQKTGSASTYGRRYTFMGAFGIATGDEDDDGGSTSAKPERAAQEPPSAPPRQRGPSDAQLKRLRAIAHANGWSNEQVRKLLSEEFHVDSSRDLSLDQYDTLCGTDTITGVLEAGPPEEG